MTEEQVTKCIISWLESKGWNILSFDFPQSGTGYKIHINQSLRTSKNKDSFIPDIVATKSNKAIFFENKDRFVLSDFNKLEKIKKLNDYSEGIKKLLSNNENYEIFYGIGIPFSENNKLNLNKNKVDFIILVDKDNNPSVLYQITDII